MTFTSLFSRPKGALSSWDRLLFRAPLGAMRLVPAGAAAPGGRVLPALAGLGPLMGLGGSRLSDGLCRRLGGLWLILSGRLPVPASGLAPLAAGGALFHCLRRGSLRLSGGGGEMIDFLFHNGALTLA